MELHPATLWESIADTVGDRAALVHGTTRRSWHELDHRAARLAGALAAAGIGEGARVGQLLYNTPEFVESYFATLKLRAVPFNVNHRYTAPEISYLLANADAEVLIYDASLQDVVAAATADGPALKVLIEVRTVAGDAVVGTASRYEDLIADSPPAPRIERNANDVTMIYTGGTTGMPKGVVTKVGPALQYLLDTVPPLLGHTRLGIDEVPDFVAEHEADRLVALPAAPLIHNTGLGMGTLPSLATGGTVVLLEHHRFDPCQLWDTVERERVTNITIVGDAFARPMLSELRTRPDRDLTCVQSIGSSGAMFSADVKEGLLEHLPQAMMIDLISASEGTMGISIATADASVPTGQFRPSAGVILVTPEGRRIEPGSDEQGLVALPGGAEGYHKDDAKTSATFRVIDGVRYTLPGDWATITADGTLNLLGRGSSCINTAGEKVFPEEVEEALKSLPGVEDALVVGLPDERYGQKVAAVISAESGTITTDEAILDQLRGGLAAYKLPRQIVVVTNVPRTAVGKADYPAARALLDANTNPGLGPKDVP